MPRFKIKRVEPLPLSERKRSLRESKEFPVSFTPKGRKKAVKVFFPARNLHGKFMAAFLTPHNDLLIARKSGNRLYFLEVKRNLKEGRVVAEFSRTFHHREVNPKYRFMGIASMAYGLLEKGFKEGRKWLATERKSTLQFLLSKGFKPLQSRDKELMEAALKGKEEALPHKISLVKEIKKEKAREAVKG
jgi:hypothetical protein